MQDRRKDLVREQVISTIVAGRDSVSHAAAALGNGMADDGY